MKVTISGFITYRKEDWNEGSFHFAPSEMGTFGYVTVQPHSFEVEIADEFDPVAAQVSALQEEKRKCNAAFTARVTEIDRRIQSLLAIANEVGA